MAETWFARTVNESDALTIARHRYDGVLGEPAAVYARWVALAIAHGTYIGWLAEACGEVVGGAGLALLDWGPTYMDPNPIRERVANVYTEPSWRRRGVARVLVEQCINEAETRGIGVIGLSTTSAARALYVQLGFGAAESEMVKVLGQ